MQIRARMHPKHSYRAALVPPTIHPEEVEQAADAGQLRTIRLRADNSEHAKNLARHVTGLPVHSVERVEG